LRGREPSAAGAAPPERRTAVDPDRGRATGTGGLRAAVLHAGARRRVFLGAVRHRPTPRPVGGGVAEAERRPAARVPRLEPRFAQVPTVLAGPDPRRAGAGQAEAIAYFPG